MGMFQDWGTTSQTPTQSTPSVQPTTTSSSGMFQDWTDPKSTPTPQPVKQTVQAQTQPQSSGNPVFNFIGNALQNVGNFVGNAYHALENTQQPQVQPSVKLPSGLKVDLVTPTNNSSAQMTVTPQSLKQQEAYDKNVVQPLNTANQQLGSQVSSALEDFRPFGAPAYAPANNNQTGNLSQLEKADQQLLNSDSFQRFNKDLGTSMTGVLNGATLGGFNILTQNQVNTPGEPKTPEQDAVTNVSNALGTLGTGIPPQELAKFVAVQTIWDKSVQALTGKKNLSDFVTGNTTPEQAARIGIDALEFLGQAFIAHKINLSGLSGQAAEALTKNIVEEYKLPTTYTIDKAALMDIQNNGGKTAQEIKDAFAKSNISNAQKAAIFKGNAMDIKIPAEKVVTMTDKPYWAKIKTFFNVAPSDTKQQISFSGQPEVANHIAGLLQPGEYTPEQVRQIVMNSPIANTPEGQQIIQTSMQGNEQGKNVKISQTTPQANTINGVRIPETFKNPEEKQAFTELAQNAHAVVQHYIQTYGNEVNQDLALNFFNNYKGYNVDTFSRVIGAIKSLVYDDLLNTQQDQRNNGVLITAGAPGVGKTTGVSSDRPLREKYAIVLDTTFSNAKSLTDIQKALDKGYKAHMNFVYRDPMEAWANGVLPRVRKEGRIISEKYFVDAIKKSKDNFLSAYEKYKDNPNFSYKIYYNTPEGYKPLTLDQLQNTSYNEKDLAKQVASATDKAYDNGQLSNQEYKAITADTVSGGSGLHSQPERSSQQGEARPQTQKDTLASIKEEVTQIPKTKSSVALSSIIDRLIIDPKLSPESMDIFNRLGSIKNFAQFTNEVALLAGEFDNEWTNIHNDIISGKITATDYESFIKRFSSPVQSSTESQSAISSETGNKGTQSASNSESSKEGQLEPTSRQGSESNTENAGSGNDRIGISNRESTLNETNRTSRNGTALTLEPSRATTQDEVKAEFDKTDTPIKLDKNLNASFVRPPISRTDLKTIIDNNGEFAKNPILTVDANKNLVFDGTKTHFSITPKALQLNREALKVGDKIKVNKETLKGTRQQQMRVYQGSSVYASSGAQSIGAFEKVPEAKSEASNFKLHKEVKKLIDKYAQSIGEGHLPRNAAGVYFQDTKNIRVNGMNDLGVAAHEITHFLDGKYDISSQIMQKVGEANNGNPIYSKDSLPLRKEMTDLYQNYYGRSAKDPLKKRMVEGFATLLEKYVEMPTTIAQEYPNLVKAFLQPEGQFYKPVMGEILRDLRGIVSNYQGLDALDKIGARVTSEANKVEKPNFLSVADRIRTIAVDNVYPLEKLAKLSGTERKIDDASMWARFYPTHAAIFANNVTGDTVIAGKTLETKGYYAYRDGTFKKVYKDNWATLITHLNQEKQLDTFGFYLVSRDQYFNWQELDKLEKQYMQYKPVLDYIQKNGINIKDPQLEAMLSETEGMNGAMIKDFIKQGEEAQKAYLDQKKYLQNNGFTREEVDQAYLENKDRFVNEELLFDKLTSEMLDFAHHPDVGLLSDESYKTLTAKQGYASMKRQIYDELVGVPDQGISSSMSVGGTKVSSFIQRTGGQNTIINPLFNALTNEREILQKGLKQIVYNKIGKLALTNQFPAIFQRITIVTAKSNNGAISFPQEKDPNIIMARFNGKRTPILTDKSTKEMIDNILTYDKMHVVDQIMLGTSRFFTRGTTALYTQFALTNFIRHQIDATAQSQNGYIPLVDPIKMLTKALLDNGSPEAILMSEYFNLGGMRQTLVGWQDESPAEIMKRIANEKSGIEKVIDLANKGMNVLAIPARYSEAFTRAAEYAKSIQKGNPQIVAFEDAGRVTAPFHHIGSLGGNRGKMFVKSIPFFNPELQYLDQAIRSATNPETRQRYFFTALVVTASIIAGGQAILRYGSAQQKQTYNDLQPNDLGRYIWLPSPDGKNLVKLPMPPQMTPVGTLINMAIAQVMNNAQYSPMDFVRAGSTILPNPLNITDMGTFLATYIPQILKPGLEVAMNMTDYPNWHAMVSPTLAKLPPPQQFNKGTSPMAKEIGQLFDLSPIKVDALLNGYLGRAFGYVSGKPSNFSPLQGVTQQDYFDTGRMVQNFYNAKQTNDQNYAAIKAKVGSYTLKQKEDIMRNHGIDAGIAHQLTLYRKVNTTKNPQQAAMLQDRIMRLINARMQPKH